MSRSRPGFTEEGVGRVDGGTVVTDDQDRREEMLARARARRQRETLHPASNLGADDPRVRSAAVGASGGFVLSTIVAAVAGESPVAPAAIGATVGGVSGFAIEHRKQQ